MNITQDIRNPGTERRDEVPPKQGSKRKILKSIRRKATKGRGTRLCPSHTPHLDQNDNEVDEEQEEQEAIDVRCGLALCAFKHAHTDRRRLSAVRISNADGAEVARVAIGAQQVGVEGDRRRSHLRSRQR